VDASMAEIFDIFFSAQPSSPTLRAIWEHVYGDDYPADAQPFSFVTLGELAQIVREVHVGPGETVVDLACGRGGPGLWIAPNSTRKTQDSRLVSASRTFFAV
jgi:hypothetical protein